MGIIDNLGYIKQASYYPCAEPDPLLVIQAAGAAAFPTLLSAISFGCNDIVKMRAGISPWHARNMKALIDGAIPAEQQKTFNGLYKFVVPVEKALFFFFVVDLTLEFLARWQSQIFKLGACGSEPNECHWSGAEAHWVSPGRGIPSTVSYGPTGDRHGPCGHSGFGFSVPLDWYWSAYFDFQPVPIFTNQPVGSVETWIQQRNPSIHDYPKTENKPAWYANKFTASYHAGGQNKVATFQEYWFMASADVPTGSSGGGAVVTASPNPIFNKGIIPVNCFGLPAAGVTGPDF